MKGTKAENDDITTSWGQIDLHIGTYLTKHLILF